LDFGQNFAVLRHFAKTAQGGENRDFRVAIQIVNKSDFRMSFLNVCRTGGHNFYVPLSLREAVLHGPPLADTPKPRAKVGFSDPKLGLWLSATHLK